MKKVSRIYVNGLNLKRQARAGEFWTINDAKARGHKSLITKRNKNGVYEYISTTHTEKPRHRIKNIKLQENPQRDDPADSYIVPMVRKTDKKNIGKHQPDMIITNPIDKSLIRKLKSK